MINQNKIEQFLEKLKQEGKSKNTIKSYRSDLFGYLDFANELNNKNLEEYKDALIRKKLSNKTIGRKFQSIRKFCEFSDTNSSFTNIKLPKVKKSTINVFTEKELIRINDLLRTDIKIHAAFQTLLQTGIKLNELTSLKIDSINLSDRIINIDTRIIPVNDKLYYILKDYLSEANPNEYLFETSNKTKIIDRNMRTYISRYIKKAKVNKTVNDIRNTFIAVQLKAGNSLEFLSKIVGHNSKQNTKRYTKLVKNYLNEDLDRVVEI